MVRFLRGLDPSVVQKVDLQPHWTSKDVCKLAIKVEKYSKNERPFTNSYSKPNVPPRVYFALKLEINSKGDGRKDKGKGIIKEFPKQLDDKRCFKCQGYGHF